MFGNRSDARHVFTDLSPGCVEAPTVNRVGPLTSELPETVRPKCSALHNYRSVDASHGHSKLRRAKGKRHVDLGVQRHDHGKSIGLRLWVGGIGHEIVRRSSKHAGEDDNRAFRRHAHTRLKV